VFHGALFSDAACRAIGPIIPALLSGHSAKAGIQGDWEMSRGGVDIDRAPQEALDLLLDARAPDDDSSGAASEGVEEALTVVPAKAGTHTPCAVGRQTHGAARQRRRGRPIAGARRTPTSVLRTASGAIV